jgi:type I restriction enzyme S subunit
VALLRQTIISRALKGDLTRSWRSQHQNSDERSLVKELTRLREQEWIDWKKERSLSSSQSNDKKNGYKKPYVVKSPPHPLPQGWMWVTISEISFQDVGLAYKSEEFVDIGIRLLRGENVKPGKIDWKNTKYYPNSSPIGSENLYLNEDEIVLGMDRPIISTGLRIAKISKTDLPCLLVQRVMRFRLVKKEMTDYLHLCLSDDRFIRSLSTIGMTGAQLPHITGDSVPKYAIPLPPLAEQHRIVTKVDALMALCDALESRLKERAGVQSKFTDAVVMKVGSE